MKTTKAKEIIIWIKQTIHQPICLKWLILKVNINSLGAPIGCWLEWLERRGERSETKQSPWRPAWWRFEATATTKSLTWNFKMRWRFIRFSGCRLCLHNLSPATTPSCRITQHELCNSLNALNCPSESECKRLSMNALGGLGRGVETPPQPYELPAVFKDEFPVMLFWNILTNLWRPTEYFRVDSSFSRKMCLFLLLLVLS